MTERLLFHSLRTSRLLLWSLNWNSKLLFLIMIFCSTSMTCSKNSSKIITYWKQWKITRRTDWTTVLRKNKLTIGLVYILNKWQTHKWVGCISLLRTVAVLLLLFWRLSCKENCSAFLYCQVPVKKWKEGVICCCKHYHTQLVKNCTPN